MAKTRDQIITRALRKLGVTAEDEAPSAAMLANSGEALDSVLAEVRAASLVGFTTSFPDEVANPLSDLLAAELAAEYKPAQAPYPRAVAWQRLMALVRPDDRFAHTFTGQWGIVEISANAYGYERTGALGSLTPAMANVRQVSADPTTGVFRIVPDGRNKIADLDQIEVRLSSWQEPETILIWDATNRDYRVTDALLAAWVAGLVGQTTQLTISDPNYDEDARARAAWF
jgi:hypothetical protein